ncbi:MAG: serine hydrolase, partial [Chlamydiae bacterium]|nr:serine hydrolase [Chlamydiota bacterium]
PMLIKRHNLSPIHFLQPPDIQQKSIVKSFSSEGPAAAAIDWLKDQIPDLSSSGDISLENLHSRLQEIGVSDLSIKVDSFSKAHFTSPINTNAAREAYLLSTENPLDAHVEVGILTPDSQTLNLRLGKDTPYGAHRIGSVTKVFTAFLALKLINDGMIRLDTKCSDLIDNEILEKVFADPNTAKDMTLDELLSHTSRLEEDDHPLGGPYGEDPLVKQRLLHDRFLYQTTLPYRYQHLNKLEHKESKYSNIGFDVAAWMLELAYNAHKGHEKPKIPFSQIIKEELFSKVFHLSEATRISPGPSGDGDVIQAGCGDMVSSVDDLLKVGKTLQQGEDALTPYFGRGWQSTLLTPRDAQAKYGLGCEANKDWIQFSGLNYEIFEDGKGRDITAHVAFPLQKNQPGIVAMCDSNALGPKPQQQKFLGELRKLAGLPVDT